MTKAISKPDNEQNLPAEIQSTQAFGPLTGMLQAVLNKVGTVKDMMNEYLNRPYEILTPKTKVKKRPDGYDYVEYSYMKRIQNIIMPLYDYKFVQKDITNGWILYTITLTDKLTGNTELGSGGARIQVKKDTEPSFKTIIDMGHNDSAGLTNAIKNAMSRFGICADIYDRIDTDVTEEEKQRYEALYSAMPLQYRKTFEELWMELSTGYGDFLGHWESKLDVLRAKQQAQKAPAQQQAQTKQQPDNTGAVEL